MNDRSRQPKLAMVVNNDGRYTVSEALDALARRHHDELTRILTARTQNVQDAADLKQEAYARLLRYPGRYTQDELRRLLFRIAGNLVTDHWRWSRVHETRALSEEHLALPDGRPGHDRALLSQQQLAHMEAVILAMPPKRRRVFVLCRVQGVSKDEVARRCGISVKTVEKHVALALAECRVRLEQVGGMPPFTLYTVR